jgi:acyl-CoA reductase-like NAD-dependent aldehyde dehydrogenase
MVVNIVKMLKQNKDTIVCYNPASLELLGTVPVFSPSDVAEAAKKARAAQKKWANTTFAERRRVLRTIVEYVATHGEEISTISREETGKTSNAV